jgi:hypothetical protein
VILIEALVGSAMRMLPRTISDTKVVISLIERTLLNVFSILIYLLVKLSLGYLLQFELSCL